MTYNSSDCHKFLNSSWSWQQHHRVFDGRKKHMLVFLGSVLKVGDCDLYILFLLTIIPVRAETKRQHQRWNDRSVFAVPQEQCQQGLYAVFRKLLQIRIAFVFFHQTLLLQYPPFYLPPWCFIYVVLSDMSQLKCGKILLWILKTNPHKVCIVNSLKRGLCSAHALTNCLNRLSIPHCCLSEVNGNMVNPQKVG